MTLGELMKRCGVDLFGRCHRDPDSRLGAQTAGGSFTETHSACGRSVKVRQLNIRSQPDVHLVVEGASPPRDAPLAGELTATNLKPERGSACAEHDLPEMLVMPISGRRLIPVMPLTYGIVASVYLSFRCRPTVGGERICRGRTPAERS